MMLLEVLCPDQLDVLWTIAAGHWSLEEFQARHRRGKLLPRA